MVFLCAAAQIKTQRLSSSDVPSWIFTHTYLIHFHGALIDYQDSAVGSLSLFHPVYSAHSGNTHFLPSTMKWVNHRVHRSAHFRVQTSPFLFSSSSAQNLSTEHRTADGFDFAASNCVKSNSKSDVVSSILILYCYWLIICDNVFTPAITGILSLTSPLFHRWMHGVC